MKNKSVIMFSVPVFAAAILVDIPLRMLQYFNNIEAGTGFYTGITPLIIVFYALLVVAFAAFVVFSVMGKKDLKFGIEEKKRIPDGVVSLFTAGMCLFTAFDAFTTKATDNVPVYTVTATSSTAVSAIEKFAGVFALVSAVYFVFIGIFFLVGKDSGAKFKLLSLAPALWCAARLVVRFTRTVSYIRVSDLMLEMLMLACFSLFFMNFAQLNSNVNGKGNEWKLMLYGLSAAVLGFVVTVPRIVLLMKGRSDMMYEMSKLEIGDLGLALFAMTEIYSRLRSKKNA